MPEGDQPISESDLARMFDEEERVEPEPESAAAAPDPGEPEPIVVADEPLEPEPPTEDTLDAPGEEVPVPEAEEAEGEEHLSWAQRRHLGTFEEAAKLAYEQEKFLGRRAGEVKERDGRIEELERELAQAQVQTPQQPSRSEDWIQQAIVSPDPGRYAFELAQAGDWVTYQQMMEQWEGVVGETITVGVHNQILAALEAAREEPEQQQPGYDTQAAIREAFAVNGVYDMLNDPLMVQVKAVADELGGASPLVLGAARGDHVAVQGLVEIARARTLTTRTLRVTEPVERPETTAEGQSPTRTPAKPDPYGEMEEEWRRMGVLPVQE